MAAPRLRAAKALVRLQNELAFRKRRVRDGDPQHDPLVARWREQLRRLRASGG